MANAPLGKQPRGMAAQIKVAAALFGGDAIWKEDALRKYVSGAKEIAGEKGRPKSFPDVAEANLRELHPCLHFCTHIALL